MTDITKDIAWYCRTVSAFFPSATPGKRKFLRELRAQAKAFLAEHPDGGYGELVARFGSPEQVADAYIAQLDSGKLVRSIRFRRICVRWAAAALRRCNGKVVSARAYIFSRVSCGNHIR